jgi:Rod binding domain-containing protein
MQVRTNNIPAGAPNSDPAALAGLSVDERELRHEATAKRFEELIATMLVKEMRESLPSGFFGDGPGSDTFNGWLDKNLGESLASRWDMDIAGMVKTDLDLKQAAYDRQDGIVEGQ